VEVLVKINLPKPIAVVSSNRTNHENVVWFKNLTALEISKLMEKADFGIFPASTVAIEACAKRLPFICGYFVDNQIDLYKGIEKNNIAICVGELNKFQETQLSEAIKTICLKDHYEFIKKQQTKIMYNHPGKRLLKIFQEL
jgi:spore coat polysaccharide biosynthesis predicted glycosyltransferase SpsG